MGDYPEYSFRLGGSKKLVVPSTLSTSKKKTILRGRSHAMSIMYEGKNVTPKPLNPEVYQLAKERQLGTLEQDMFDGSSTIQSTARGGTSNSETEDKPKSTLKFKTEFGGATYQDGRSIVGFDSYAGINDYSDLLVDLDSEHSAPGSDSTVSIKSTTMYKPPSHVSLILSETSTDFILDLPSCTALKDTEDGEKVEKENEEYEYITVGKGRNRKVVNSEAQTIQILMKSRTTDATEVPHSTKKTFASNWDMFDTFDNQKQKVHEKSESSSSESDLENISIRTEGSVESFKMASEEKEMLKLIKNSRFQEAICVIERLLANNYYNEAQKTFRGLIQQDIFREDIEYKYNLNFLWTFANNKTKGRCVTCLEWNPCNEDLLAVGYGKFYFADNSTGMVMIWNIKNPVQPERTYNFAEPVTTLSFSKQDPNLLAIGFYNGQLVIINIASRNMDMIAKNIPTFEPLWCVVWRKNLDPSKETEQICASYDNGSVMFYTLEGADSLQEQQMMRVSKAEGRLKGYNTMRKCSNLNIPVSRYAGARFIRWHPVDPNIYFVGTNEGVVHKCSTNYLNQHVDLFLAHEGPINDLKYSPFSTKVYVTCGDDWFLRIWAEGISQPLKEVCVTMMPVQAIDWSPTHSTILAAVYGKSILLWDFQRKIRKPQSETQSPTGSRNTVVQFTRSGRCLVVGDIDGNVHVYSLEDLPFPAFYQENLLFDSLERGLSTNLIVLEKVKKLHRKVNKKNCSK